MTEHDREDLAQWASPSLRLPLVGSKLVQSYKWPEKILFLKMTPAKGFSVEFGQESVFLEDP